MKSRINLPTYPEMQQHVQMKSTVNSWQRNNLIHKVVGIATRWRNIQSGDRIPVEAKFFAPVQNGPGTHQASYTTGAGSPPRRVKRPGRGVDHPSHLAPRLNKE